MATDHAPPTGDRIKVAVLGTGSLGKEHARIYAGMAAAGEAAFAGVHDTSSEAARAVADRFRVCAFATLAEAAEAADAFSVGQRAAL